MPRHLLSIYQPSGGALDPQRLERIKAELHRLNERLSESGSWYSPADCTFLTGQRSFAARRRNPNRYSPAVAKMLIGYARARPTSRISPRSATL